MDIAADERVKLGLDDDCSTGWGQIHAWLNEDETYNIRSVAYLTIYNAHQIGAARPSLTTSLSETQALLARYNGTNDAAQKYGRE
ncbi:hypothetical protein [Streptomyces sp. UG1]|uniref:hypothetical protein n=1 Tax=Streptomyces sp. UG1 TaxID=3417652 RepID=UPI003CE9AF96